jgi:hypothetical protein
MMVTICQITTYMANETGITTPRSAHLNAISERDCTRHTIFSVR